MGFFFYLYKTFFVEAIFYQQIEGHFSITGMDRSPTIFLLQTIGMSLALGFWKNMPAVMGARTRTSYSYSYRTRTTSTKYEKLGRAGTSTSTKYEVIFSLNFRTFLVGILTKFWPKLA